MAEMIKTVQDLLDDVIPRLYPNHYRTTPQPVGKSFRCPFCERHREPHQLVAVWLEPYPEAVAKDPGLCGEMLRFCSDQETCSQWHEIVAFKAAVRDHTP